MAHLLHVDLEHLLLRYQARAPAGCAAVRVWCAVPSGGALPARLLDLLHHARPQRPQSSLHGMEGGQASQRMVPSKESHRCSCKDAHRWYATQNHLQKEHYIHNTAVDAAILETMQVDSFLTLCNSILHMEVNVDTKHESLSGRHEIRSVTE